MKRLAIYLVAGCLAIIALTALTTWVYSLFYIDDLIVRAGHSGVTIRSVKGRIIIVLQRYVKEATFEQTFAVTHENHRPMDTVVYVGADHQILGIGFGAANIQKMWINYFQSRERVIQNLTRQAEIIRATGREAAAAQSFDSIAQERNRVISEPRFVELIEFPYWLIAIIAAIVPIWCLRQLLRARWRKTRGLCLFCGYDMRATPEQCPECGTIPAELKQATKSDRKKDESALTPSAKQD